MSEMVDPNREAVGMEPIWTGAVDDSKPAPADELGEAFDPSAHTVDDVAAYVAEHPDEHQAVLAAERAGKARVTLLAQLEPADDAPG